MATSKQIKYRIKTTDKKVSSLTKSLNDAKKAAAKLKADLNKALAAEKKNPVAKKKPVARKKR